MTAGDPRVRRRQGGRGVRPVLRLARRALPGRDGALHRRQLRLAARPREAVAAGPRTRAARRLRQARQEGRVVLRRRAAAADLQLPVDVRRAGAVRGAGPVRASSPTWTRSRACTSPRAACTPWPAAWPRRSRRPASRSATTRPSPGSCASANGPVVGVEIGASRACIDADAVVCNPDLPVAYRELLRRRRGAAGGPQRQVLAALPAVGRRREGPAARRCRPPQHPLRPRLGRGVQGAHRRRRAHARPVDPRDAALARRPIARPRGCTRASTCSSRRRTSTARSTGRRSATRIVDSLRERVDCARLPDRRGRRARSTTRPTGSAWAWSRARRSRSPTRSSRPARSGRTTSTAVPGLVFVGSSTLPGVGVPMVLVSGKLAAERVEQFARQRHR